MSDAPDLDSEAIDITLWLRTAEGGALSVEAVEALGRTLPAKRRYLTRTELDEAHSQITEAITAVSAFLESSYGLRTVWRRWRAMRVRGTLQAALQFVADACNARIGRDAEADAFGLARDEAGGETSLLARTIAGVFTSTGSSGRCAAAPWRSAA